MTSGDDPVEHVGPDRVERDGDDFVVHARRAMPSWEPRRFRRVQVEIHGVRYFVAAAAPTGDGGCLYRLRPWSDDVVDRPAEVVHYDLAYVQGRDRALRAARDKNLIRFALMWFSPIVGLLPSAAKRWLQDRVGLNPIQVTAYSVYAEFAVGMALGGMVVVYSFAGPMSEMYAGTSGHLGNLFAEMAVLYPVFILLIVDAIARVAGLLRDSQDQYGFYEWLVRFVWRKIRRRADDPPR